MALEAPPTRGDIAISGDTIAAIGNIEEGLGKEEIDASGQVVAPGFINMLSWATVSLIHDGNSESDIRQGVTLEVMGEGSSMGPWNDEMKAERLAFQKDITYDIEWTTLGEYLQFLEDKGVSTNVASFVGATTLRIHELKEEDRAPNGRRTRAYETTRQNGNGGRCNGNRFVSHLRPRLLCKNR